MAACLLVFLAATPIERVLGKTGNTVPSRLLGVILAAMAVQFVVDGVKALWGESPSATACMMRPGRNVNTPAIPSAPPKIEIIALRCCITRFLCACSTASGSVTSVKIKNEDGSGLNGPTSLIS